MVSSRTPELRFSMITELSCPLKSWPDVEIDGVVLTKLQLFSNTSVLCVLWSPAGGSHCSCSERELFPEKKCLVFRITAGVIHKCVYGQFISCGDVFMNTAQASSVF